MQPFLVVGLGNPGQKYLWTRHNAGFMVLDRLAALTGLSIGQKKFAGLYGQGEWQGQQLLLLKPQTFMNLSGRAVAEALRFHKLPLEQLVVIHDDLDLPFGQVRVKAGGGHGGHNGLRSLQEQLGSGAYLRLRIGIGRPLHGDSADYVLANFPAAQHGDLARVLDGALDALALLLSAGPAKAMGQFNNKDLLAVA